MNDNPQDDAAPLPPGRDWLPRALVASWREIAFVVFLTIGLSALSSAWMLAHGSSGKYMTMLLTDARLVHTILIESAILGVLLVHLKVRGWKPANLRIKIGWLSSAQGLALVPAMALANTVTVVTGFTVLYLLQTQYLTFTAFIYSVSPHLQRHSVEVGWLTIICAMVVNAFFEEITCMGYAFNQFAAKHGPAFALGLTVLLRMLCHTYQGPVHALGIAAAFSVFGLFYWWTRNLWPLILAHIIVDTLSFGMIKLIYS